MGVAIFSSLAHEAQGSHGFSKKKMNHIQLILEFKALILFFFCNNSDPLIFPCFQFIFVHMVYVFPQEL